MLGDFGGPCVYAPCLSTLGKPPFSPFWVKTIHVGYRFSHQPCLAVARQRRRVCATDAPRAGLRRPMSNAAVNSTRPARNRWLVAGATLLVLAPVAYMLVRAVAAARDVAY